MSQPSKSTEIYHYVKKHGKRALAQLAMDTNDEVLAKHLKVHSHAILEAFAMQIGDAYSMLELADIMEWKRTRSHR